VFDYFRIHLRFKEKIDCRALASNVLLRLNRAQRDSMAAEPHVSIFYAAKFFDLEVSDLHKSTYRGIGNKNDAGGRSRTGTALSLRRILSHLCMESA